MKSKKKKTKKTSCYIKNTQAVQIFNVQIDGAESKGIEAQNIDVESYYTNGGSALGKSLLPLGSEIGTFFINETEFERTVGPLSIQRCDLKVKERSKAHHMLPMLLHLLQFSYKTILGDGRATLIENQ